MISIGILKLVVIGVHSSKFSHEKSKSNVLNASRRLLIKHPIVCDLDMKIWSLMEIICWPTLLVIDPNGIVIAEFIGETQANQARSFLVNCFKYYQNSLQSEKFDSPSSSTPSAALLAAASTSPNSLDLNRLNFPTRLCLTPAANILFISDSGHNRILGVDAVSGAIRFKIGSGARGSRDGSFEHATFDWPQGLAFDKTENKLYVADTFNDLIRVADLNTLQTSTLCGKATSREQVIGDYDYTGGKSGLEQAISSPWDVYLHERVLLIACAGTHQIWLYSLDSQARDWWRSVRIEPSTLICIAGNGKERNKNNSYPLQASFAQPSGLCMDEGRRFLYIADAESSSIRFIDMRDGAVKGLVGGDHLQPDNLFAYGDLDGKFTEARFQHPLDVKLYANNSLILVDTYNNCLKQIDLTHKLVRKVRLDRCLNEPNGFVWDEASGRAWITDTNRHAVRQVDRFELNSGGELEIKVEEFVIRFSVALPPPSIETLSVAADPNSMSLVVCLDLDLNESAPNSWKVKLTTSNNNKVEYEGVLSEASLMHKEDTARYYRLDGVQVDGDLGSLECVKIETNFVYCELAESSKLDDKVCKVFRQKLEFSRKELRKLNEFNKSTNFLFARSFLIRLKE